MKKLLAAALILIFLFGSGFTFWYKLPMAPHLAINQARAASALDFSTFQIPGAATCGTFGNKIVLALGLSSDPAFRAANAIRLVHVTPVSISIFALPGSLRLETPSLKGLYGIETATLREIYPLVAAAENGHGQSQMLATTAIAQTIYDNFGIGPDQYITFLSVDEFWRTIDTFGGIKIGVRKDFWLPDGRLVQTGTQTMDADTAWQYFITPGESEWDRFDRQNAVFAGLEHRLLSLSLGEMVQVYQESHGRVVTDFTPEQIATIACIFQNIDRGELRFKAFPEEFFVKLADGSVVFKDPAGAATELQKALGR